MLCLLNKENLYTKKLEVYEYIRRKYNSIISGNYIKKENHTHKI